MYVWSTRGGSRLENVLGLSKIHREVSRWPATSEGDLAGLSGSLPKEFSGPECEVGGRFDDRPQNWEPREINQFHRETSFLHRDAIDPARVRNVSERVRSRLSTTRSRFERRTSSFGGWFGGKKEGHTDERGRKRKLTRRKKKLVLPPNYPNHR